MTGKVIRLPIRLTFSCIMFKNCQTYFENLGVFMPQDFKSMFDHFSTLCMKVLTRLKSNVTTRPAIFSLITQTKDQEY